MNRLKTIIAYAGIVLIVMTGVSLATRWDSVIYNQLCKGLLTVLEDTQLGDSASDKITANAYFTQVRVGTGTTFGRIGSVGADELGVEGDVELDGSIYLDGTTYLSGTALSATASEINTTCDGVLTHSFTWNPGSLADGAGETVTDSLSGAALGDFVLVAAPYDLVGITATAYVQSASVVGVRIQNETGTTVDLASDTWKIKLFK